MDRRPEDEEPDHAAACSACWITISALTEYITTPCGESYCEHCLRFWYEDATAPVSDFTGFPPTCCAEHQLPLLPRAVPPDDAAAATLAADVARIIGPDLERAYWARYEEWQTADKTYCAGPACGAFVPAGNVEDGGAVARCAACGSRTCVRCKAAQHEGDCPAEEGAEEVEALAERRSWTRCAWCRSLVELVGGCYHMR